MTRNPKRRATGGDVDAATAGSDYTLELTSLN